MKREDFGFAGVLQFERHHRAGEILRQQALDVRGVGMRRVAREMDALDPGMRREPRGQLARVGALLLHAQRQRLDAAHGQIGFERAQIRAESAQQRVQRFEILGVGNHHAAQHVAVARQIFGRAVDHDARAEFKRPHQHGRREGVVDNQRRVGGASHRRDFIERANAQQGIGDGLDHHRARLGFFDRGFECRQIGHIRECRLDAQRAEYGHQHVGGGAVEHVARDHSLGAVDQRRQHRQMHRHHARRARQRAVAAFEFVHQILQRAHGGIVVARIGRPCSSRPNTRSSWSIDS